MGHKDAITIAEALRRIQENEFVLPAIQREYVWKPSQVIKLFDSTMRGYPVGSFLSWRVKPDTIDKFKFYGFMREYSAFDKRHNPQVDISSARDRVAILDGQQRLTSLNIGLRGTYAYKNKGGWSNKAWSYPTRMLYLNLLEEAPENEAGLRFHLAFLTEEQLNAAAEDETKKWFPVAKIYDASEMSAVWKLAIEYGVASNEDAQDMLSRLWTAVHGLATLQFYEEEEQDIERVLDIFVRVNSGGTVLSYSNLLMSIATAQWKEKDARNAIHELVDSLNRTGQGFDFSQDTVLKAGLVLADIGDIGFKVKNFDKPNMATLEKEWDGIRSSLEVAASLLSDFGLSGGTLTADSVLIPVAYYVHKRQLKHHYRVSEKNADLEDRAHLRSWVLRSLIVRGIWGSGLDTLLREIREVIRAEGSHSFPIAAIEQAMAKRGKSLEVTDALIQDILELRYGGGRTWAVLAIVFDHVDTRMQYHVDHVYPKSLLDGKTLKSLKNADGGRLLSEETVKDIVAKRDSLPNLQLLQNLVNIGKSDMAPDDWARAKYPDASQLAHFLNLNALPDRLPHSVDEFLEFLEARKLALADRIREKLSSTGVRSDSQSDRANELTPGIDEALAEADADD